MDIYFVTKNDPVQLIYVGLSVTEAMDKVSEFQKYERDISEIGEFTSTYTALPRDQKFEMVKFYGVDGWWYSIVKVKFEAKDLFHHVHVFEDHVNCSCGWGTATNVGNRLTAAYQHARENRPSAVKDERPGVRTD